MTTTDPAAEYSQRLAERERAGARLERRHFWTGNARLAIFFAAVALCWTIIRTGSPSWYWLLPLALLFGVAGSLHSRILRALENARRAVAFYQRGIARIEDRWSGTGDAGEQFRNPDHLYAEDLDILGQGSLFQLLCVARSRMGKECLARWLLSLNELPASARAESGIPEIRERQAAVAELKRKTGLREALILAGETETINADPARLKRWADAIIDLDFRRWWPWALLLAALNLAAIGYAVYSLLSTGDAFWTPFLLLLMVNASLVYRLRTRLQKLFAGLDEASHNLGALAEIFRLIEQEKFESSLLRGLHKQLFACGEASQCVARLGVLCELEDSRHNMIVRLIDLPLLYSVQVGLALQRWRSRHGAHITRWLDTLGEFEALFCLATYAFEHPQDPFPEFAPTEAPAMLVAEALGHPLLPSDKCVRNDVALGGQSQLLLVSGSNMSGKSTLLRSIGINTVLAMIGAPVRARKLRLSATSIGASIHISDSLQKGVSHFYAEISRIRQVVDLSARGPLLFLFDEILQGTNSRDRRIGAQGIVHTLLRNGALGLVTTHDLSLTSLVEVFPASVSNVHFQEKLEAGKLSFDYLLRPGVVTTSNGVELMKSIGLDV